MEFVARHLWGPVERAGDPNHGMPDDVETGLHADGSHAPDTAAKGLNSRNHHDPADAIRTAVAQLALAA